MLGAAVFLSWLIYSYLQVSPRYEKANPGDKEALLIYLLGVVVCFVLSTALGTFINSSSSSIANARC